MTLNVSCMLCGRLYHLTTKFIPISQTLFRFRSTSTQGKEVDRFVTTPIFYVNAAPHLGHLYTALLADAHARWNRLKGQNVLFTTGTDEHGLKIQQAASKIKVSPLSHCDQVSRQFQELFKQGSIQYDDFVRTTEDRHRAAVEAFWERLQSRGHIYQGSYEGWYSVSDEAFLSCDEVKDMTSPDGTTVKVSADSEQPVTWMKEQNYMFALSQFREPLTKWVKNGGITPSNFEPLVYQYLGDLKDLSVSRDRSRLPWGIPVPGDNTQTVYVWLDALINYLTVAGYPGNMTRWPPSTQIIGKDILKFHAIYWPAFLMAADLSPPSRLLCHSHWLVDGKKMSKSRGNVIDPGGRMQHYTVDGLRYYLLKTGTPHSDGNYTDRKAVECINNDMVNTLGNLLNRCTSVAINSKQEFPPLDQNTLQSFFTNEEQELYASLKQLPDILDDDFQHLTIYRALEHIMSALHAANALVQRHKPWELVKQNDKEHHLNAVLHVAMETMRVCGITLQPVIPELSDRLLTKLGVTKGERSLKHVDRECSVAVKLGTDKNVLMTRVKEINL